MRALLARDSCRRINAASTPPVREYRKAVASISSSHRFVIDLRQPPTQPARAAQVRSRRALAQR